MHRLLCIVPLALCILAHTTANAQRANEADSLVLVGLYQATDGHNWHSNTGWLQAPLAHWTAVDLDTAGRVVRINLRHHALRGFIPPELGNLASLRELDLSSNTLAGPIPSELGKLSNLQGLDLYDNLFTGPIPPELGDLTNLKWLSTSTNLLSGSIPPELGNLVKLEHLALRHNRLTGPIPPELGSLTYLRYLTLENNLLSGSIPLDFRKLAKLWSLDLSNNQLSGSIPPELGKLTSLQKLDLSVNQLSGSIPSELGKLTGLNELDLKINQLTGPVPELDNVTWLRELDVGHNRLDSMPDLTWLPALSYINVANNRMSFEELELNSALTGPNARFRGITFYYAPQDSIDTRLQRTPTEIIFTVSTGGHGNRYQWYKDGQAIAGATAAELSIDISAPKAVYNAEITHPRFPSLTLTSIPLASDATPTFVGEVAPDAITMNMHPNYPNPFTSVSEIPFDVAQPAHVRITVYDTLGRLVKTLVDAPRLAGQHRVSFNATGLTPGLYHYRMQAGDYLYVRSMIVLR